MPPRLDQRFSLDAYRALVEAMLARGYRARTFETADPAAPDLILRHDIDVSIAAAVAVAEVESALGVRATYFVLVRSLFYNPFSPEASDGLDRLRALGHEIGLHFDAALYRDGGETLDAGAARECAVLETILGDGARIRTVSLHRPAAGLANQPPEIAGRTNAYAPRFVEEMGYCSDSRGGWRYGHPLDHPAVAEGRGLQLLTHPIWWVGEGPPAARLAAFLDERARVLDEELAAHCDVHEPGREGRRIR